MKRAFVIMMAAAMLLTLLPATALAGEPVVVSNPTDLTTALTSSGDIKLGADIDAGDLVKGSFFTVPSGNTVTLDLNGHTLQGTRIDGTIAPGTNRNTAIITNNGTLTIKDSVGSGRIVIDTTKQDEWSSCTAAVSNSGSLTIESGTLLNLGGTNMAYAADNLSNGTGIHAYLTVNGGLLKSENYIALRLFANSISSDFCTATINGGTLYGYKRGIWIQQPTDGVNGEALLTITGGKVEAQTQYAVLADLLGTDGVDIFISGGQLVNHSDTHATLAMLLDTNPGGGGGYAEITGGTFLNTGTAGNLTVNATGTRSVIAVSAGTFSSPVPSGFIAEGADPEDILDGTTDVSADVNPTYTIIIPVSVDFGTLVKGSGIQSRTFNVTAQDLIIESGAHVNVAVSSDFTMSDGSANLSYALYNGASGGSPLADHAPFVSFDANGVKNGRVEVDTANINSAGDFVDTMVFTITYVG